MAEEPGWSQAERIADRVEPPTFPGREFPVTEYGAVGDGETDCTDAFERAIAECTESGGGRVVVPEGTFVTGAVHLDDDVELHVTADATIAFSQDPDDYLPVVLTRYESTEVMNYSPMIYAYDKTNVAITGAGTLDARGDEDHWWPWCGAERFGWEEGMPEQGEDHHEAERMGAEGVPVEERVFGDGHYLRPNFVQPYDCENVLIEGVTVRNSPSWLVNPVLCENVTVRDLTIDGDGPNNDGVDPECCTDVVIRNCTFDAGDDCIAIKSGRENDGRRVGVPSSNILIEDCEFRDLYGAITIGSEMSGDVRNVYVRNCTGGSDSLYFGLYIKTNSCRGGTAENVYLKNLEIDGLTREFLRCNFHRGEGDTGEFTPTVRNVELRDVTVKNARGLAYVRGYERSPVQDLRLVDCTVEDTEELRAFEDAELTVENVDVDGVRCDSEAELREQLPERE